MPEWTEYLRPRLAVPRLSPSRESEIIEELSQHLDLRYEELDTWAHRLEQTYPNENRHLVLPVLTEQDGRTRQLPGVAELGSGVLGMATLVLLIDVRAVEGGDAGEGLALIAWTTAPPRSTRAARAR